MAFKKLEILNEDEIGKIDSASIEILEKIGFYIPYEEMLSIADKKGASVNFREKVIKVDESIVRECIKKARKKFIVYGVDKEKKARFGYGNHNFLSSASQYIWIDLMKQRRFKPELKDIRKAIILADNLENINMVGQMGVPTDIDVRYKDVACFLEQLKYTGKPPYVFLNNGVNAKIILKMCELVRGSKEEVIKFPFMEAFVEPISPLRYLKEGIEILIEFSRYGLPIGVGPMAMIGVSAPCTIAGTLAIENADILSAVVLSQFINPGTPINYWGIPHAIDYISINISFGSPEQVLMGIALNQIGSYYGFPVGTNTGLSDAITPDAQSGVERGISMMLTAIAGSSIFGHIGICGADQGFSLHEMVIEDEMISYIKRVLRTFKVSDETLALDVIKKVGRDGNFLIQDHTLRSFKKDIWFPSIYNRNKWENWVMKSNNTLVKRADIRMREILSRERNKYISDELEKELDAIVNEYMKLS